MSTPGLETLYSRAARRLQPEPWLVHTYTREVRQPGQKDPYGEDTAAGYAAPESGQTCYYKSDLVQGFDMGGNPVVVTQITLTLLAADQLKRGDRVSHVVDRNQVVVEDGPMYVKRVSAETPFGPVLYRVASLSTEEGA